MYKRFIGYLLAHPFVVFIRRMAQMITLPGFQKMSLYDVSIFFFKGMKEGDLAIRAAAVSFNFFLALFPSIIFIFTLIPYIPIINFQEQLLELMGSFMPHNFSMASE